jgi:hypothetical protein
MKISTPGGLEYGQAAADLILLVINIKGRGRFHVDGISMVTEQARDGILCIVMHVNLLKYVMLHAHDHVLRPQMNGCGVFYRRGWQRRTTAPKRRSLFGAENCW